MVAEDRQRRPDRATLTADLAERARHISPLVRRQWRLARADLAGRVRSESGGRLFGDAAAIGAALGAIAVGLAVVVVDLLWLPWPLLLLFVVVVLGVAVMVFRLIRRHLPPARPMSAPPPDEPAVDGWARADTVPLSLDGVNMRRRQG